MKKRYFSLEQLNNMQELKYSDGISVSSSKLYLFNDENDQKYVMKQLQQDDNLKNKIATLELLSRNKDLIGIDSIIIPESLGIVDEKVIGPITPYIESYNLKTLYQIEDYPTEKIKNYLYQIGEILEKVQKLNENRIIKHFALGDVHEANFIIDKTKGIVSFLDVDTCRIEDNLPSISKYLNRYSTVASMTDKLDKYKFSQEKCQYIEPTVNTDLYCYIIIIMNYLYKSDVHNMDVQEFYNYLEYLRKIGFSSELVDAFSKIYSNEDNINPKDLLETIPNDISLASASVYCKQKKR